MEPAMKLKLSPRVIEGLRGFAEKWRAKYVVIFGSRVRGLATPLSDWDVAVKLGRRVRGHEYVLMLSDLMEILDSERVDLVMVDRAPAELRYEILWLGEPVVVLDADALLEDKLAVVRDINDLKIKLRVTAALMVSEGLKRRMERSRNAVGKLELLTSKNVDELSDLELDAIEGERACAR